MSASKLGFFSDELGYSGQDIPEQLQMKEESLSGKRAYGISRKTLTCL